MNSGGGGAELQASRKQALAVKEESELILLSRKTVLQNQGVQKREKVTRLPVKGSKNQGFPESRE